MKEFIEKLIGRLEEISVENTCSDCPYKAKCDEVQEHINDETTDLCGATIKALSIEIVNQLAEEYRQDLDKDSQYWIPTTERLPEKNAIVLTCDKDGWISVKVNMPYAGVKNDFESGYYTAWMPLPEPFTPKEGRE